MNKSKFFFISFLTLIALPQTSHAYLVPLLGGAGAAASFIGVILIVLVIFGFFIWYHCKRIFGKAKTTENNNNPKYKKSPSLIARFIFNHRNFWIYLANKESKILNKKLIKLSITRPIYITGLARSGTTILLETLANNPTLATQKYRDFPFIFTPYFWNKILNLFDKIIPQGKKRERSHRDGLLVNSKSPEAMEEPIWMAHFPFLHHGNDILSKDTESQDFANFYDNHLKKIILSQKKERYLCKGNYNLTRIPYLTKLYPDAKAIIMIRNPKDHIYSLMKQHKLFKEEHQNNPQSLTYMNMLGHFEFGANFIPINLNQKEQDEILELLKNNQDIKAWSKYWANVYQYVLQINKENNNNILIIRYEDLCDDNAKTIKTILKFCNLTNDNNIIEFSKTIKRPEYYQNNFSEADLKIIKQETKKIAKEFGYK